MADAATVTEPEPDGARLRDAYARRPPKVGEVIPALYLRGLSNGGCIPVLESLLGWHVVRRSSAI